MSYASPGSGMPEKLHRLSMDPQSNCGPAFGTQLQREVQGYTKLARELDLKAE